MKITVHMASRGRQFQLIAALMSLRDNESGKHDVRYAVACDVDDFVTIGTLQSLQAKIPLGYRVGHRPVSLDSLHNQLTRDVPADVYVCFVDDALCLTKDWDERVAESYAANPKGVWWWKSKGDEITLIPIVSEAWREAAGGIFPEHFPYWWGDTWLSEVWALATEGPLLSVDAWFVDCPKKTHGMRELRFWHDYYLWLQPERIEQAKTVAALLGWAPPSIPEILAKVVGAPSRKFRARIEEIEQTQGEMGEPHEGYRVAKARALAAMSAGEVTPGPEIDIEDVLTPEVIDILVRHFPDAIPEMVDVGRTEMVRTYEI